MAGAPDSHQRLLQRHYGTRGAPRRRAPIWLPALAVLALIWPGPAPGSAAEVWVQSGDITARSAVVWARCNAAVPTELTLSLASTPAFDVPAVRRVQHVGADTDFTASASFGDLETGRAYFYRAECVPATGGASARGAGRLRTAPAADVPAAVEFAWLGDIGGQGWGRNPELRVRRADGAEMVGGYVILAAVRRRDPDFVLLQGDIIYADNPLPLQVARPDGSTWVNAPGKDFAALTLAEFRANWRYQFADDHWRRLLAATPKYTQWDDHEVYNNWWPGQLPAKARYRGHTADQLAAQARQALGEYSPLGAAELYQRFRHGRHLELFLLDTRSYRGPNPANAAAAGNEMLGPAQFAWLKRGLKASTATWKVISSSSPLTVVAGGDGDWDAWGQGDNRILGREVQLAALLAFIRREGIANVLFISSDVHFAAAIRAEPARATDPRAEFRPFWEFIAGPAHAGAFGPAPLDPSFGPHYEFARGPATLGLPQNTPPPALQSFGAVAIAADGQLTLKLLDATGQVLFSTQLIPD